MKKDAKWIILLLMILFAITCFAGLSIHSSNNVDFGEFWFKGTNFIAYFLPPLILHFVMLLANKELSKKTYLLLYVPAFFMTFLDLSNLYPIFDGITIAGNQIRIKYTKQPILFYLYFPYMILNFISTLNVLQGWEERANLFREKKTVRILIGFGMVCFTASVFSVIYFTVKGLFLGLLPVTMLFWFFGVWYAMIKYKFTDITSVDASEAMLEKVKDLILLVDQEGSIIRVNNRVNEILGYTKEDLYGKNFKTLFDQYEKILPSLSNKSERKNLNDEYVFEADYIAKNGELVPVKVALSLVFDRLKDLIGIVIIGQDMRLTKILQAQIAEKQRAEKELIASNEKLKELDQMKTDFLSMISHELRTPLTSILGFAKIIKKKLKNVKKNTLNPKELDETINLMTENLGIIVEEGERLGNLINDVLDIQKMEAGKVEWRFVGVNIQDLIERAFDITSALLNEKHLDAIIEIEEDMPKAFADYDRLLQVLINLLSNAIKFTDEGYIRCVASFRETHILVTVTDSGIGIGKNNLDSIFEKFKQVGDTLTNRPKGTGLGLPICKQIIEKHGGSIWVDSEIGQGSTFYFTVPVEVPQINSRIISIGNMAARIRDNRKTAKRNDKSSYSILVADDDANILHLLKQVLSDEGYRVTTTENGLDALKLIEKENFDIVILDVVMPDLDGFEIANRIKKDENKKNTPIIILSAMEDRVRGFQIGIDRYITKPVDMDEILKNVGYLLDQFNDMYVLIAIQEHDISEAVTKIMEIKGYYCVYSATKENFMQKVKELHPKILVVDGKYIPQEEVFKIRRIPGMERCQVFFLGEEPIK